MKAWCIFVAAGAILLATSAWAQEKPRLGFKDIYLGMPKEALRQVWEKSCREEIDNRYSKWETDYSSSPARKRSKSEQFTLCFSQPSLTLWTGAYTKVGSISLLTVSVHVKDEKVGAIRLYLSQRDFEAMEAAIKEKYGPPLLRTVEVVKNKLGAAFNSEVLTWELKDGTILMKERSSSLDMSEVIIASYTFLDEAEKERKARAKKDAGGL